MGNSFKIFSVRGIAIYVNWSWLFALAIITWSLGDYYHRTHSQWTTTDAYLVGLISALLLFATVVIHELAHSFTARANGLPVQTITLFIFGGVSNLTREPQSPRIELLVAVAGPLASLVLAGLFYVLHATLPGAPPEVLATLGYLASINLILAIFNLIPGFPLDGGRVLRALLWQILGSQRRATRIASNIGQGVGYLFIILGLLEAFLLGQFIAGILLAGVGWFLQMSAQAGYQQAVMDRVLMGVDVHDVMDRVPQSISPNTSIEDLVTYHMLSQNQRALPVDGPDGRLLGLVTLSDVSKVDRSQWPVTPVHAVMTRVADLVTVAPTEDLRAALRAMAETGHNQLPVVQNGDLIGILNRSHVLQYIHMRELMSKGDTPAPPTVGAGVGGPR